MKVSPASKKCLTTLTKRERKKRTGIGIEMKSKVIKMEVCVTGIIHISYKGYYGVYAGPSFHH